MVHDLFIIYDIYYMVNILYNIHIFFMVLKLYLSFILIRNTCDSKIKRISVIMAHYMAH